VVNDASSSDVHSLGGIDMQPNPCAAATASLDGCPAGDPPTKTPTASGFPASGAEPFTVYAYIPCSPVGMGPEIEERTVSALRNGEGRAVERVFWTGAALGGTVEPHLAEDTPAVEAGTGVVLQTAASVVTGGVTSLRTGFAVLEGALSECYGGEGVIHVPAAVASILIADQFAKADGERLRSTLGHRVAAYASNNREGPSGSAPAAGSYWLYATGAVTMVRSAIFPASTFSASVDRTENTVRYIAERSYVLDWDCCHIAVQVTLS
jgi:hypothetical protein